MGIASIRELSHVAEVGQLKPLWMALHRHHRAVSRVEGLVDDDTASWSARRASHERWMRAGNAIALVADLPPRPAIGYPVELMLWRLSQSSSHS